ncbi:hypothetical protein BE17_52300 [Sorangium cellulosum]|uniref:Uncharacterized protein n=1 Tax=Sorangium cellulosum TaxID=56 RepID=A0A150S174_SORCE|nr:hypothetical protein BE17_52300 [Sorangium cellulosum]
MSGLRRLAAEVAAPGALRLVQLFRGSLRTDPRLSGVPTWSASAGALLDKGATAVALGPAAIVNPAWPQRIAGARAGRIRAGRAPAVQRRPRA